MRETGCLSPAHVPVVGVGKRGEAASQGLGRGLLELVSRHLFCLWSRCSDATFQENRTSQEFKTIIPSDRLVVSLRRP